jgi:hypothetical protein
LQIAVREYLKMENERNQKPVKKKQIPKRANLL